MPKKIAPSCVTTIQAPAVQSVSVSNPIHQSIPPTTAPPAMQLDFYIRSPEVDTHNNPTRKVFDHFFAMEVTWK